MNRELAEAVKDMEARIKQRRALIAKVRKEQDSIQSEIGKCSATTESLQEKLEQQMHGKQANPFNARRYSEPQIDPVEATRVHQIYEVGLGNDLKKEKGLTAECIETVKRTTTKQISILSTLREENRLIEQKIKHVKELIS